MEVKIKIRKRKIVYQYILIFIFFGVFGLIGNSKAAGDIYVAPVSSSNFGSGYSGPVGSNGNNGTINSPLATIAHALTHITDSNGGWKIILRGGTYYEHDIYIPVSKTGVGTTESTWNSMQSYPGEWAIIDGQRACTANPQSVIGNSYGYEHQGSATYAQYWLFERLEITGGGYANTTNTAGGIWWNKGPVKVRYCYIHDNLADDQSENPAGFNGISPQYVTIEYCHFKNNGSVTHDGENGKNVLFMGSSWYSKTKYDENWYQRNNVVKYNRIESGGNEGIGMKTNQRLTPDRSGNDLTHKTWGDDIHHNIITEGNYGAIHWQQDFAQIHNNIVVVADSGGDSSWGITLCKPAASAYQSLHNVVYNNTIINAHDAAIQNNDIQIMLDESFPTDTIVPDTSWWCLNNLIDNFATYPSGYNRRAISLGTYGATSYNTSHVYIDGNYIYKSSESQLVAIASERYTQAQWESAFPGQPLYYRATENPLDLLYQGTSGANQYKSRGDHVMEGTTKIKEGGLNVTTNNAHPYLTGVKIPIYVGATNPDDDAWVDGVYTMNADWFKTRENGSTPPWAEDAQSEDTIAPASPSGLSVS